MIQRITVWGLVASNLVRGSGMDSEFGRSFVEAAHRALAYAPCVDIGNFKEVSGRPRPSFRVSRQMAKHSRAWIRSLLDRANADLAKKPLQITTIGAQFPICPTPPDDIYQFDAARTAPKRAYGYLMVFQERKAVRLRAENRNIARLML